MPKGSMIRYGNIEIAGEGVSLKEVFTVLVEVLEKYGHPGASPVTVKKVSAVVPEESVSAEEDTGEEGEEGEEEVSSLDEEGVAEEVDPPWKR